MNERNQQLKVVSNRLVWSLLAILLIGIPGALLAHTHGTFVPTPAVVLFVGFVAGLISLQRRLKILPPEDLTLLANSWVCIILSPIAGAILAVLVYLLFISGLLQGDLFPTFLPENPTAGAHQFGRIFDVYCPLPADYAKVLFWSFVAGFSEKFVTDIIGQLESRLPGRRKLDAEPPAANPL